MKINYHFDQFDYKKYYYFFDGERYFEVEKMISSEEYNNLNSRYYQKINSPLFDYLFGNHPFPYQKNFYKFIVIELNDNDNNGKANLLSFLKDIFHKIDVMELKNKTVCFYYNDIDIDLKNILTAVTDDLGLNIKVYESGKLDIKGSEAFRILFEMYLQYSIHIPRMYTNNSDLILDIAKTNIKELKTIKPIILNKIYNDAQLEKLIYSMFDNNLNVTKTAQDVYMHRNTINNKLELIKRETTLSLQNFKDAVAMYLLLKS